MIENNEWGNLSPIRGSTSKLLSFPVNALPPVLKDIADGISKATCSDIAMSGTAILSSISYCFSDQYRIVGKKEHTEPLVLDSLTVAEPSFHKSPVMKIISRPYEDYLQEYNRNNKAVIFENQAKRKLIESEISAMEKDSKANAKDIANLQVELSSITNANFRRIIVEDITPESLVRQLAVNGTLLMMSDEAGSLMNFNGRYSNNVPNIDLLLKSWSGEPYTYDRITREPIFLQRPYMSICLACQPYIWDSMITNTYFRGSGFLARLLYCFPRDMRGNRTYNGMTIPDMVIDTYKKLIYKLLNEKFRRFESNDTVERLIYLDEKANKYFVDFYNDYLEKQLITDMAFCSDWCGKMHGQLLRICGIIHCVKCVLKGEKPEEIKVTLETFLNALDIIHYFREQTIYAYGLGDSDAQIIQAEYILKKVKTKYINMIRQNDLYKICRCKLFKNAAEFGEAVSVLDEYGYLKSEIVQGANGNNKSGIMLYFNPQIFTS